MMMNPFSELFAFCFLLKAKDRCYSNYKFSFVNCCLFEKCSMHYYCMIACENVANLCEYGEIFIINIRVHILFLISYRRV